MHRLFKIRNDGKVESIDTYPFADEPKDLEDFIIKNASILGDVAIINRQITLPDGKRIDLWGLDLLNSKPIIIELKNKRIGDDVLTQIMDYYLYVKENPDSLKAKAMENTQFNEILNTSERDVNAITEAFKEDPKVIIIAPGFKSELLKKLHLITFDIELIEMNRFKTSMDEILVSLDLQDVELPEPSTVRVSEEWNWEKYKEIGVGQNKIELARKLKARLDDLLKEMDITNLLPVFRKRYIPYQFGRKNVFWINHGYTANVQGDVLIGFYLEENPDLANLEIPIAYSKTKWFSEYYSFSFFFDRDVDLSGLKPFIQKAYDFIVG